MTNPVPIGKDRISISKPIKIGNLYTSYADVKNLNELIKILENNGIAVVDISNYPPYDNSPHIIESNLSIYDISDEIYNHLSKTKEFKPFIVPVKRSKFPIVPINKMIEETYLPFKEKQIAKYFENEKHLKYYVNSANNYKTWKNKKNTTKKFEYKIKRQIEKDERFWVAQALMTIFEQLDKNKVNIDLCEILTKTFGETPPTVSFRSWEDALKVRTGEKLILRFEENIPSPKDYKIFLSKNFKKRHIIPYVIQSAENINPKLDAKYRKNLEGSTNVDALIINPSNGFNVFIEAKVLSDISYQVSYDAYRNQIARNVDVMLTSNKDFIDNKYGWRFEKDKSFFVLLTPKMFKNNPHSRLYGYKMEEYLDNPLSLMADLNYRTDIEPYQWANINKRIGWLTWEEINKINRKCCSWL